MGVAKTMTLFDTGFLNTLFSVARIDRWSHPKLTPLVESKLLSDRL